MLSFRFRSRASLELELVASRHQLMPPPASCFYGCASTECGRGSSRPRYSPNRRRWSNGIAGLRINWRWRSRCPGRPKTSAEIRALIRRMSRANPLWSAPRIHGELLKLGVEVSQATDGRHLPRRRNAATFKLLYAVMVPDRCVTGTQGTYGYYAEQLGKLGLCIEGRTRGQTRRFLRHDRASLLVDRQRRDAQRRLPPRSQNKG
jgi:hypothetical protein